MPQYEEPRPGDHVVVIYEDAPELTAFSVPFIKDGLAKGERCVYLVDDLNLAEATAALIAEGVDVNQEITRGALVLVSAREYFSLPPFDGLRLIALMRRRVIEANVRGFMGVRIAAEMTWTLHEGIRDDAIVEFETLLDKAVGPGPLTVACMYRRDRFRPGVLQRMTRNHTKVVAADHVYVSLSTLFQTLGRSDLEELLQSAAERRTCKGEFYFRQGDQGAEVFVLTHGAVKIVRTEPDGRSAILLIATPTETFGIRKALVGTARMASAQALEDSRALVWKATAIHQVMLKHPEVSLNAVRLMAERIEQERDRLLELASSSVERRLARLLLRLAQSMGRRTPSGVAIEISLSGHDLAELAITTSYTVSRILAGWRRLRIVDAGRERIVVQDQQRITALAGVKSSDEPRNPGEGGPGNADMWGPID